MFFKILFTHFKKMDWVLIFTAIILTGIGIVSIYSSSFGRGDFLNLKKQIFFLFIGFIFIFLFSFFDWRVLRDNPYLILTLYFICLFLLLGLFFFGYEIRNVKIWYKFGDFTFDPIVITELVLTFLLAKYFSTRHIEMYRVRHILLSGVYVLLPSVLIFFQPNLGSALILLVLWIGILVVSGIKLRHFLALVFIGILLFTFSWGTMLKEYQKERILSFFKLVDPLGINWSQNQAKIAVGSGCLFGQGFGRGSQTQYGFLPKPQTDFIFAAIAEEFGFIGVGVVLVLFSIFFWRIIKIAILANNNFPRLFATGFAIVNFSQFLIHIAMNLGLLPIIGISLPLVSYGGSNLIAIFIGLGILESIKINYTEVYKDI